MTRAERFMVAMRRWAGITICLESLGPRDKDIVADLFLQRGLGEVAKKHKLTKERVNQIRERAMKTLMDMVMDEQPLEGGGE